MDNIEGIKSRAKWRIEYNQGKLTELVEKADQHSGWYIGIQAKYFARRISETERFLEMLEEFDSRETLLK